MKIAFLGDSITFGYGLEDKSKKYSTLVSNALGLEEENFGITGTLVAKAGMNKADGKDFLSRLHLIKDADISVVFGGTNDYFWSDEKIFGDTHDEKYFADAIESICKFFNEERKGKISLLVTPYSHNGVGNYLGGESHNTSSRHDTTEINYNGHVLHDYVKTMTDIAKKYGVPCLDLHKELDFDWRVHTLDGCHPNDEGHALLADAVTKALKVLINKNKGEKMSDFTYETEKRTAKLENYEWDNVWWDTTGNNESARALYIGDSISCATRRLATGKAEGKILFDGFGTSKAIDNPYFIPALRIFAEQEEHREVIFLNNGLHGWHLSEEEYAEHYEKLVCFLLEEYKGTPLVLVMTTFVTNEERNARVIVRNDKARAIAEKYGLDTVDLYAVSQSVKEYIRPDGVHFAQEGSEALAEALVECAKKHIKN